MCDEVSEMSTLRVACSLTAGMKFHARVQFDPRAQRITQLLKSPDLSRAAESCSYFELLTPGIITLSMSVMISFHSSGLCGASDGKRGFMYPGCTVGSTRLKIHKIRARVMRAYEIRKDQTTFKGYSV